MNISPIWQRCLEALEEAGLSTRQVEIAALCGVKPPSVAEWKYRGPGRANLRKIAEATGVSFDWLETGRAAKYLVAENEPDEASVIAPILRELTDEELDKVISFARYLRNERRHNPGEPGKQ